MANFGMSELVKDKNRIYNSDKVAKRVINSNDMIMEKLAKLQSEQETKTGGTGWNRSAGRPVKSFPKK